jgi:hypothetical protein
VWRLPDKIARSVHEDNDMLLNSVIEGTPLPFMANKRIFSSVLNLHRVEGWHKMIDTLSARSKWALHKEDKARWFSLALGMVEGMLKDIDNAECISMDPTGKKNLALAVKARKKLRRMKRRGEDVSGEVEETIKEFAPS